MLKRSLAHAEAVERAKLIAVDSYDVRLDLRGAEADATTFDSESTVRFRCSVQGASSFAEWRSGEPATALLNGRPVAVVDGRLSLDDLQDENELVVRGRGEYSTSGEGLHRAVDPADGEVYVYSMCFLHEASRVFACFDQPDLKATIQLTVTAPEGWTVVSNSPAEDDGVARSFAATPKLPTYLLALAAGPYASAHSEWKPDDGSAVVPLALYCRKSLAAHLDAEELFAVTRSGLSFFTRKFDVSLPFPKYDQLFAPEFNAGAMENPGLVIHMDELLFRSAVTDDEREFRALVVMHEMAHMWFGDYVSMRWWDDLWLNEAFAEFCGYLATAEATQYSDAWTSFSVNEKSMARTADVRPSSHPVASVAEDTDQALLNFDAISYFKGACLLKQLAAYTGHDAFFVGLHNYFDEHAWGNTELADLLAALASSSGRSLGDWGDEHLRSAGVPDIRPEPLLDDSGALTGVMLHQGGGTGSQVVGLATYALRDHQLVLESVVEADVDGDRTVVPASARQRPDLLLVDALDVAYARTELDSQSLSTLAQVGVNALDDSLARAVAWGSLWDMVQRARYPVRDFVELVSRALPAEDHPAIVTRIIKHADLGTRQFCAEHEMSRLRAVLADACGAALHLAPEHGHQLALVRAQTWFATTPEQLTIVSDRLDGPRQQDGVSVDADLRWTLLTRLVAGGRRGASDIDAEEARDPTAFGRHKAQEARAALGDRAAKEEAWRVATGKTSATNRLVAAACRGFWQLEQLDLCRPFVERYFDELERVWRDCDVEVARLVTDTLFPRLVVEPTTLAMVESHLTREGLPFAQRRSLKDAKFDLERALAVRAASAQQPG